MSNFDEQHGGSTLSFKTPSQTGESGNVSRRLFLGTAASAALGAGELQASVDSSSENQRQREAYRVRVDAALQQRDAPQPKQENNGDEVQLASKIGNYSKGLPHDQLGEVDPNAYQVFSQAIQNGGQLSDIDAVPMGSPNPAQQLKFVNPCAGQCFDLQGADSHHLAIPPAPRVQSAETAGEMVELYWQALARDVPFSDYGTSSIIQAAVADLNKLADFRGPKTASGVAAATLFRGITAGDVQGPYLSQFLVKPIPFGAQYVSQQMRTPMPGIDFLTSFSDWLSIQNGVQPTQALQFDKTRRYIRNGRDLGQWVHIDVLYQAYFNAMLMLVQAPDPTDEITGGGMGVPLNAGNPYLKSKTQVGFGTFGPPGIATAVAEIATRALKAVWHQKWFVHRRLRPEAFGGLVHNTLSNAQNYPLHSDVLNSQAAQAVNSANGSYLLPMAFPEGSPLHPSYGAGHATVAGASVTILKALFDETYVIPNPVMPSADGLSVVPYTGPDAGALTVGGELNKLASNVALGRNFAGVHWRSDYAQSVLLGEAVAISVLQDQRSTYKEPFNGFTFTKFDGTKITV
jgi:hypothetical protein